MISKSTVLTLLLISVITLSLFNLENQKNPLNDQFQKFKATQKRVYKSSAEQIYRKNIFLQNLKKIQQHNSNPLNTHQMGITSFADLTEEEFIHTYLGTRKQNKNIKVEINQNSIKFNQKTHSNINISINAEIDWTSNGKVSPIKNQGRCGSCWAFSATGAVQSAYRIYKNDQTLLSEQQLVDCSAPYGNNGCGGGWMDNAFAYIRDHGISTEEEYPYLGRNSVCKKDNGNYKIGGFVDTPDCFNLYNAIHRGPISVAVDASNWALYRGGILSLCGENINHGVLVVGASQHYWKIKNSWGVNWGQEGYIRISRGNTCAVCDHPSYPFLQ